MDVAVVGAGQSGLAVGYFLRREGIDFTIFERADSIGSAWRERWDSLALFTPRRYDSLPGLPFAGDPDGHPGRDEVIAYLERYADAFELPVQLGKEVRRLTARDAVFQLETDGGTITAAEVVVATGPFQEPYLPELAQRLDAAVVQTHSTGYRRPEDVASGTVLVVGGGNTGFQIAKELAAGRTVVLAVGSRQKPLPQRLLGRDVFWWLTKTRLLAATLETRLGRKLSSRDTLIGSSPRKLEKRSGVEVKPRLVDTVSDMVRFEDGSTLKVDSVIWATGYRPDYSWIKLPVLNEDGRPRHRRGVTEAHGLYFLGLTWQFTRGSALIGWVKHDAEFIAERIAANDSNARPFVRKLVGAGASAQAGSDERR